MIHRVVTGLRRARSKSAVIAALCVAACFLLLGAAAPIMPSNGFYINDYASCIPAEYSSAMLETSRELFGETGVQLVLLTVESAPEDDGAGGDPLSRYAESVFRGWDIGGAEGKGVLLLLFTDKRTTRLYIGPAIAGERLGEKLEYIAGQAYRSFADGEFSRGLYNGYFSTADELFFEYGAICDTTRPDFKAPAFGGPIEYAAIALLALLIVMRGWRLVAKNRKKLRGFEYLRDKRPRTRAAVYDEERGTYGPPPGEADEPDDLPSGFGGAVTVKERTDIEDAPEPVLNKFLDERPAKKPQTPDHGNSEWHETDDARR
jgi:uncharacterized membrane protein YgcG